MGKEGEGACQGTRIEDSWAQTVGVGTDCGSGGRGYREGESNGEKGRTAVTEQQ